MTSFREFSKFFKINDLTTWLVIFAICTNKYYNLNLHLGNSKINNFVDILISSSDLVIILLIIKLCYVKSKSFSPSKPNQNKIKYKHYFIFLAVILLITPILINPSYGILMQSCRLFLLIQILLSIFKIKIKNSYLYWATLSLVIFSTLFDHYLLSSSLPVLLLFILYKNLSTNLGNLQKKIIYSYIFLNFITAIWQVVMGYSLGFVYAGEPTINNQMLNIARENLFGQNILRGHGMTQHAGILGFVGSWSVIFALSQDRNNKLENYSTLEESPQSNGGLGIIIGISLSLLSLSRIAWLGLFIPLLAFVTFDLNKIKTSIKKYFWLSLVILGSFLSILGLFVYRFGHSDKYRILDYQNFGVVVNNLKIENWLFGVGYYPRFLWQNLNVFANPTLHQNWEFQPVHNTFLDILVQWGILGCLGWIGLIYFEVAKK